MVVDKAFVVESVVDMLVVVGDGRLVGLGLVLGIVSCEDPHSMMCLVFHAVDSPLDEFACTLVLSTPD